MTTKERLHELVDELSEPKAGDALQTLIQEAASRILRAAPPGTRLILFGSAARGHAGEHSDLDFLVIEPEVPDAAKESVRLRRTLSGLRVPADVIVVSQDSVREWRDVYGTVIHSALTEGRELAA